MTAILMMGCPSIWQTQSGKAEPSAAELYESAEKSFDKGDYAKAIELYDRLRSAHSDFDKMPLVYQKVADAFFKSGKYDDAVSRYRSFLELYPNHEQAVRAKYMISMCYFNQLKPSDRDSTTAEQAAAAFKAISEDPNAGEWKEKAKEKYRECQAKLAEKELYKAKTYVNMKNYKAARIAAQRVLDQYGGVGFDEEAKAMLERLKGR